MGKRRGVILTSVIALALVILGGLAVVGSHVHTEKEQTQAKQSNGSERASSKKMTSKAMKSAQKAGTSSSLSQASAASEVRVENMTDTQVDDALKQLNELQRAALIMREMYYRDPAGSDNDYAEQLANGNDILYLVDAGQNKEEIVAPAVTYQQVVSVDVNGDSRKITTRYAGGLWSFTMSMREAYRRFYTDSERQLTDAVSTKIKVGTREDVENAAYNQLVSSLDPEKVLAARVWLSVYPAAASAEGDKVPKIAEVTDVSGKHMYGDESATYSDRTKMIVGNDPAFEKIVFKDNGDGTISVYDVPGHFQDTRWQQPDYQKNESERILNNPHVMSLQKGDKIFLMRVAQ